MMSEIDIGHYVTVAELRSVLERLDSDLVLEVNAVGNFLILEVQPEGSEYKYKSIGYVDLLNGIPEGERIEFWNDEDEDEEEEK